MIADLVTWNPSGTPDQDQTEPTFVPAGEVVIESHKENKYCVSYTSKGKHSCVHLTDGCWRVAGKHFHIYQYFETLKGVGLYDEVCKDCWKIADANRQPETDDEDTSSDDESETQECA